MLHLFLIVLPFLIFTIFIIKRLWSTAISLKHLPPSPPRLPILGNLHQLGTYPHRSLQRLAQRYGELMVLHFGARPVLIISSADAAREIMKTNDSIFANRPRSTIADRLLYGSKSVSSAPYGEYWRQMRSICVLQLLTSKRVQSFRAVREEELTLLTKNVKQSSMSSLPVNLSELFISLTNDVICRVAFGKKYSGGEAARKFKKLLEEFMILLGGFYVGDFIPLLGWVSRVNGLDTRVEKVAREFDEFLDSVVEEHMCSLDTKGENCGNNLSVEGEDKKDLVDVLLQIQKQNTAGFSFDRDSIKGIILDIFGGGTDTSYTVLEWAMTELIRHPRVLEKLQNELMGIATGKPDITESDLDKTPYLKAVIKETLRLYPPIPLLVPRESTQATKIRGYDVAARTMVIINAWTIGRDPSLWDEPEEFKPDRFLNSTVDFKGNDFELIPFGAGRRGCPGSLFAMVTNEIALANLVHKFDWTLPDGARAKDLSMVQCTGLVIHRKAPLVAMAIPRF
ncbi:cytochrome P450 71A3-like [Pyrus ussuriensis x Pyrus communis]|uniref:Cytochrome P450 71A3-like n=1 Tax=Pyrus ussuriensis x Pyrus communis TaxID=2448454 RepID=A0A5N5I438_9ROSA|nr:cytochrome P450 71A3-like [Pyrus ussuriensis x Pyrus communis]